MKKYSFLVLLLAVVLLGAGCDKPEVAPADTPTDVVASPTIPTPIPTSTIPPPATQLESAMRSGLPTFDSGKQNVTAAGLARMAGVTFDQLGTLTDVTEGNSVRGITIPADASGDVGSAFDGSEYVLYAHADDLPTPQGDDFYEGWVVRPDPFAFVSTGALVKRGDQFINGYSSKTDLSAYTKYIVTLEPNDGDPAPAIHIVEGVMAAVAALPPEPAPAVEAVLEEQPQEEPAADPIEDAPLTDVAPTPVPPEEDVVFCTQDAKQCADGSFVSRQGPSCEFAACPETETVEAPSEVTFTVSGRNFSFAPAQMTVKKGDKVTINFESAQGFHDWTVDEFDAQTRAINTGSAASVTFVADQAGSFEYYCSVGSHRQAGMVGTLVVTE